MMRPSYTATGVNAGPSVAAQSPAAYTCRDLRCSGDKRSPRCVAPCARPAGVQVDPSRSGIRPARGRPHQHRPSLECLHARKSRGSGVNRVDGLNLRIRPTRIRARAARHEAPRQDPRRRLRAAVHRMKDRGPCSGARDEMRELERDVPRRRQTRAPAGSFRQFQKTDRRPQQLLARNRRWPDGRRR